MSTYFLFCSESGISFPAGGRGTIDEGRGLAPRRTKDERRKTADTHQAGAEAKTEAEVGRKTSAITTRKTVKIEKHANSSKKNKSHERTKISKSHKNTPNERELAKRKRKTKGSGQDPRRTDLPWRRSKGKSLKNERLDLTGRPKSSFVELAIRSNPARAAARAPGQPRPNFYAPKTPLPISGLKV